MTTTEKAKKISNLISKVFEESLKDSNQELISKLAKDLNTCKHTAKTTLKLSTIIIESVEKKGKQKGVYTLVTLEQLQNFVPSGVVLEQVFFSDFKNQVDGTGQMAWYIVQENYCNLLWQLVLFQKQNPEWITQNGNPCQIGFVFKKTSP